MVIERQIALAVPDLLLLLDRDLDEEHVAGLQVLGERIDRHHLAGANREAPVLRDLLELRLLAAKEPATCGEQRHGERERPIPHGLPSGRAKVLETISA